VEAGSLNVEKSAFKQGWCSHSWFMEKKQAESPDTVDCKILDCVQDREHYF